MSQHHLPKKELGQHWLNDQNTLEAICELADIKLTDTVLEIGPGLGSLTERLIAKSREVVAIELDDSLISKLEAKFSGYSSLKIHNQDIRYFDLDLMPVGYKVVANIPYYLTSYLIR